MATKNPRISVMLKPESDVILTRLAAVTKQSKSSIIAEFLEDTCMPMFERMVVVLEAAATATDDAKAAARQGFAEAEEKLLGVVGMTTDLFDQASSPILEDAAAKRTDGRTRKRPPARPDSASRPPHVTRGSGTPNTPNCTCQSIEGSLVGNPSCPVHSLAKASKRASKPRSSKVKG